MDSNVDNYKEFYSVGEFDLSIYDSLGKSIVNFQHSVNGKISTSKMGDVSIIFDAEKLFDGTDFAFFLCNINKDSDFGKVIFKIIGFDFGEKSYSVSRRTKVFSNGKWTLGNNMQIWRSGVVFPEICIVKVSFSNVDDRPTKMRVSIEGYSQSLMNPENII